MAAVIGDTALRAMHEGKRSLEAHRGEYRAERLARLGGIDRQGFAGEVLLAIFRRLGPFANALDLSGIAGIFEHLLLVRQHLLVFRAAEKLEVIEHMFGILRHGDTLSKLHVSGAILRLSTCGEPEAWIIPQPSVLPSARFSTAPW